MCYWTHWTPSEVEQWEILQACQPNLLMYTLNNAHHYNDYLIVHWLGWVSEDTTHCMELTLRGKSRPRSHDLAGYIITVTIAHLTVYISSTMVSFWATDDKLYISLLAKYTLKLIKFYMNCDIIPVVMSILFMVARVDKNRGYKLLIVAI